jgi:hypothetical protein
MPYRLIYASSARRRLAAADLEAILDVARRNNARQGISGMLLYKDGNFIQLLEGAEDAILRLFETIKADSRHRGIVVLDERPVDAPALADWSMGFREVDADAEGAGLFKLTEQTIDRELADTPRTILRFMRNFYAINRS